MHHQPQYFKHLSPPTWAILVLACLLATTSVVSGCPEDPAAATDTAVQDTSGADTATGSDAATDTSGTDTSSQTDTAAPDSDDSGAETTDTGVEDVAVADAEDAAVADVDAGTEVLADADADADALIDSTQDALDAGVETDSSSSDGDAATDVAPPLDPCVAVCEASEELACPNDEGYDECYLGCTTLGAPDSPCSYHTPDLFDCLATSEFACNADGNFAPTDCDDSYAPLEACLLGLEVCGNICPETLSAQCSQGPPTLDTCIEGCQAVGNGPCTLLFSTLLDCLEESPDSTVACDDDGAPQLVGTGCETQNADFQACLAQ